MTTTDTRLATLLPTPSEGAPAGPNSLGDQRRLGTQRTLAAEGSTSPQASPSTTTRPAPPAGTTTAHPVIVASMPKQAALEGRKTGQGHARIDTQSARALAAGIPGGHVTTGPHRESAAGDSDAGRPIAIDRSAPDHRTLLADPLLALAADVLDDLEKVRIANENRLRQLTRSEEDADGETRGFGLDESHPDVARLAALVDMLGDAEHKAELNLGRLMRQHPLGPWIQRTNGLGVKQMARLVASIGDPYIRPEITLADGTVEPSRPRMVSELWAYAGYHVIRAPVSGHLSYGGHNPLAADGPDFPADPTCSDAHTSSVGGGKAGHSGHNRRDGQTSCAGVAPKRARGQKANWSADAKMRAYLIAVSCMKCLDSPYRKTYDDTRAKYAEAVHAVPCVRCGPSGKPAAPGSALSDGHKHARALRAVAKEVLRDLWREAKRIHEGGEPQAT